MLRHALIIAVAVLLSFGLDVAAREVTDQFGQTVPAELAAKVEKARQLRLPYVPAYNPEEAVRLLREVVAEKDDYYRAWFNLGLAYGEVGDYEEANSAFNRAVSIMEEEGIEDITIFNSAGWVNLTAGKYDIAEELFKRGLMMKEHGSEYTVRALYNNIGLLYFYTQRLDEAEEYLTIARNEFNSESAAKTLTLIDEARQRTERVLQQMQLRSD